MARKLRLGMPEKCKTLSNRASSVQAKRYDRTFLPSEFMRTRLLPLLIVIDRASATPIKDQIYHGLRELIVAGHIARGATLPSTRAFAAELSVSRNTMIAAFEQLISEGYVKTKSGAGSFVCEQLPEDLLTVPCAPALAVKRSAVNRPPRIATHAFALGI